MDLHQYIAQQMKWSMETFGSGKRTEGLSKHVMKELQEIAESDGDLWEWIDVIILGIDGAWRSCGSSKAVEDALINKQRINAERRWPRIRDESLPIEHIEEDNVDKGDV